MKRDVVSPAAPERSRWLPVLLMMLAAGLAANSLLGPLALDVIEYRFSESLINQGVGLDAVALAAVVPLAVVAAILTVRSHRAGPILAFVPSTFTLYMAPQYVIGPDYLGLPGNNERFVPFHFALFVLAAVVGFVAWRAVDHAEVTPNTRRSDRFRSALLTVAAGFIAVGMYADGIVELVGGDPTSASYQENPTSYLLIAFLDLAIVVPGFLLAAWALATQRVWARTASYVAIGWFSLVPAAVAAMSIVMSIEDDPNASTGSTIGFVVAGAVFTAAAASLYRPLFEPSAPAIDRAPTVGASLGRRLRSAP